MTDYGTQARAEAVEAIKAHLTEFLVDYDAEELAWNILNDLGEVGWAAGRAETASRCSCTDMETCDPCIDAGIFDRTEDAAQVIESTRHYNGSKSFIVPADAARALADAGLLRGGSDG